MTDIYRAIVVTDAIRSEAQTLVEALSDRAEGMWTTPLAPAGATAPTHWISAGPVDVGLAAALVAPSALKAVCDYKGYSITLAKCEQLLAGTTVSDGTFTDAEGITYEEDGHAFIARIGLALFTEEVTP